MLHKKLFKLQCEITHVIESNRNLWILNDSPFLIYCKQAVIIDNLENYNQFPFDITLTRISDV